MVKISEDILSVISLVEAACNRLDEDSIEAIVKTWPSIRQHLNKPPLSLENEEYFMLVEEDGTPFIPSDNLKQSVSALPEELRKYIMLQMAGYNEDEAGGIQNSKERKEKKKQKKEKERNEQNLSRKKEGCSLFVRRNLAHLLGLRHRSVWLLLIHPDNPAYVILQLRSPNRIHYAGAFDLTVTGHVTGDKTYEEALEDEAFEETGLPLSRLATEVRKFTTLSIYEKMKDGIWNAEAATMFIGTIRQSALKSIPAADTPEVSGFVIFRLEDLHHFLQQKDFSSRFSIALLQGCNMYMKSTL